MRDNRYMHGPEIRPLDQEKTNKELIEAQNQNYQDLLNGITDDLPKNPKVTTGTGVYTSFDGANWHEQIGSPRLVVSGGYNDYINEPAPAGMPYVEPDYFEKQVEPRYYTDYKLSRNSLYRSLLGNAIKSADFSDMFEFSVASKDPHFARRLRADLVQRPINQPSYDVLVGGSHHLREREREQFNEDLNRLKGAFNQYVVKDSNERFRLKDVSVQDSFLRSVLHAIRTRRIKKFINEKYLTPLGSASHQQAVEYVVLEEAKKLAKIS